jgi:hypothetical protein
MLALGVNSMNGTLPEVMGNLTSLTHVQLEDNRFTGTIPNDALGRLTYLELLVLDVNRLSGVIPASNKIDKNNNTTTTTGGLCNLVKNGILTTLVMDCAVDIFYLLAPTVDCACCTKCSFAQTSTVDINAPSP